MINMKVVKENQGNITIDEINNNFQEIIVAAYDVEREVVYNLVRIYGKFAWSSILDDLCWNVFYSTKTALENVLSYGDVFKVRAFYSYTDYLEWLTNKTVLDDIR